MRDGGGWVRATFCRDIPLREGRAVRIGSHDIAIFNLGDRFLAIENHCPHKGGPLAEGIVSGATVVCPLHTWKFSLESGKGVTAASELSCVRSFSTRVEHGIILIQMNREPIDAEDAGLGSLSALCSEQEAAAQSGSPAPSPHQG